VNSTDPADRLGRTMSRPVIALLTDFGTRDHYAGTMKGVALGICPEATLVDISHDLPPHDVLAAALELAAAYKYFPPAPSFSSWSIPASGRRAAASPPKSATTSSSRRTTAC